MSRVHLTLICASIGLLHSCTPDKDPVKSPEGKVVKAIYIDSGGTRWFATDKGITSFDGKTWINYNEKDGLPGPAMNDLTKSTSSGVDLWIAADFGSVLAQPGSGLINVQSHYIAGNSDLPNDTILSIAADSAGYIWMGTKKGLAALKNESEWFVPGNEAYKHQITDIGSSPAGWNYFTTLGKGVARNKSSVDGISGASSYIIPWAGLPSDNVYAVYVDPVTGYQWFGTDLGAAFHMATETKSNWTTFTTSDGLADDFVLCITGAPDGSIWFGTKAGVSRYLNETWTTYSVNDGLANNTVYAIAIDHDESVWFGTANGVSHLTGGTWQTYR